MIEVNLHPTGEKRKAERKGISLSLPDFGEIGRLDALREDPWRTGLVASVLVVALAVGGMWYTQRSEARGLETRLEAALADSIRLAELRALSDSLVERRRMIEDRTEVVRGLDNDRFVWPHLLDEVSRALPEVAWLTGLRRQTPIPELSVQLTGIAPDPVYVTEFIRSLERSPFVEAVQFRGSQRQTVNELPAHGFTLTLDYRSPPEDSVPRAPVSGREGE